MTNIIYSNIMEPSNVKALPYDLPYLTDELKKRAKIELFEDEETRKNSLKMLKNLLDEETNLYYPDDDDIYLLSYLRTRKFDVKRTFSLLKLYYSIKKKHEELYGNVTREVVERTLSDGSVGFFPYRDDDGAVILRVHFGLWNPNLNSHADLMRLLTGGLHHACRSPSTQVAGIKVIADFKYFTASKISHISPKYMWLLAEALQNCFPARFKGVHIVNESPLVSPVLGLMKKFVKQKLADRFHFHGKNVTKLHKYINPKVLPKEYGGELPHYSNAEWAATLMQDFDHMYKLTTYGYVKS